MLSTRAESKSICWLFYLKQTNKKKTPSFELFLGKQGHVRDRPDRRKGQERPLYLWHVFLFRPSFIKLDLLSCGGHVMVHLGQIAFSFCLKKLICFYLWPERWACGRADILFPFLPPLCHRETATPADTCAFVWPPTNPSPSCPYMQIGGACG